MVWPHNVLMVAFAASIGAAGGAGPQTADPGRCTPAVTKTATPADVRAFFKGQNKMVLTFLGYADAGYENPQAMLQVARRTLQQFSPKKTIVNIRAASTGIGAIYEPAKLLGFATSGIVSTEAKASDAEIAPCVDFVFFVKDSTLGGFMPGTSTLSPTSQAMIENSDLIVAIGGSEMARDEYAGAQKAGKDVLFIPADMHHATAIERARKRGQPPPTEFKGAVADVARRKNR
jgi:hypothetical protein